MKTYRNVEDLILDPSFQDWVLRKEDSQQKFWTDWVSESSENFRLYEEAKLIITSFEEHSGEDWNEGRKKNLFDKIEGSISNLEKEKNKKGGKSIYLNSLFWFRVASVVMILAISVLFVRNYLKEEPSKVVSQSVERIEKSNPVGQKSKIHLSDGSVVFLNTESTLSYDQNFGITNRDLALIGEAYFEVAHDSILPFRVNAGGVYTEAVGTAFNINSYPEQNPRIQLVEGKVKIENILVPGEEVFLVPGEEALIKNSKINKKRFDRSKGIRWKDGVIQFSSKKVTDVMKMLERWYGVEIDIRGDFERNSTVTGEYQDARLENVLKSLGYSLDFDFSIENKQVTIQFKNHEYE